MRQGQKAYYLGCEGWKAHLEGKDEVGLESALFDMRGLKSTFEMKDKIGLESILSDM